MKMWGSPVVTAGENVPLKVLTYNAFSFLVESLSRLVIVLFIYCSISLSLGWEDPCGGSEDFQRFSRSLPWYLAVCPRAFHLLLDSSSMPQPWVGKSVSSFYSSHTLTHGWISPKVCSLYAGSAWYMDWRGWKVSPCRVASWGHRGAAIPKQRQWLP